jgi:hypothetical protein
MLSKAEIRFLKHEKSVSPGYARVLRHRVRRKLEALETMLEEPEILRGVSTIGPVTGNRNAVTEFCNGLRSDNSENEGIGRARRFPHPNGFESITRGGDSSS